MSNIPRIRAPGLWVDGSVVLSEEFEAIDAIRPWMINGAFGSTNAPTVQIDLGGAGLRVSGASRLDRITVGALAPTGTFTVVDRSTLVVDGGSSGGLIRLDTGAVPARIDLNGANSELRCKTGTLIRVQSGGQLKVEAGGAADWYGAATWYTGSGVTVQTGVTWVFNAGSTINSSGVLYFANGTWPAFSPVRNWERRSLLIATTTFSLGLGGPPQFPNAWKINALGAVDQIETRPTSSASDYTDVEFVDLPIGGTLVTVTVECVGNGPGTVGMSFPSYQVIRWRGTTMTTLSALTADTHVLANWDVTPIATPVTITSNPTINPGYRYGVRIYHAYYGGSPAGAGYFTDCVASGTTDTMRV